MAGHQYAQSIWAEQPIESNGFLVTKINAETELFKYPTRSTQKETLLTIEMMKTSLSGLIIHPEDYKIPLRSGACIHRLNTNQIFPLSCTPPFWCFTNGSGKLPYWFNSTSFWA